MRLAGARRLAGRLHRGQVDEAGEPYLDHLGRVAARVAGAGGTWAQEMAAWLHGAGSHDLLALGVPRPVVRLVEALTPRRWEPFEAYLRRVEARRGALAVLRAVYADRCRPALLAALPRHAADALRRDHHRLTGAVGEAAPPEPDLSALLAALDRPSGDRDAAVAALGRLGDRRAVQPLVEAYRRAMRGDHAWAPHKDRFYPAIYTIAHDPRHRADPDWAPELVSLARHELDAVRTIALSALARAGDPAHQPLFRESVGRPSPGEVCAAVEGLDDESAIAVLPRLIEIAGRKDRDWRGARRTVLHRLSKLDDPRARAAVLADDAVIYLPVGEIARRYRAAGPGAVPGLVADLHAAAPGRWMFALALGECRDPVAVPALAEAFRGAGDNPLLAVSCVEALGKIASPDGFPMLAEAARHHRPEVRTHALRALRHLDDPRAGDVALAATDDPVPEVRAEAARLLATHGGPAAVGRLCALTEGPHAHTALRGLLRLADPAAVPSLVRTVRTATDRRTRHLAGRALARSASTCPPLHVFGHDPRARRVAIWLTGHLGAERYQLIGLVRALRDPDELVRARAAAALARRPDPTAVDELVAALDDPTPRVRAAAATALGALPGPASRSALTARLTDPHRDVRAAASAALRRLTAS